jgi:glycosyltransferase involved in cell wall biosynthesis
MKIAQVAPLWESVPPKLYGGTERIVSYLTEELVGMGHEVTLFASGDSRTAAQLEPVCERALRLNTGIFNRDASMVMLQERALGSAGNVDIVHSHVDFLGFPLARRSAHPVVTTLHGRLDLPELTSVFREYSEMPLVSISDAQRRPMPWANWQARIPCFFGQDRGREAAGSRDPAGQADGASTSYRRKGGSCGSGVLCV